MAIAAETQSNIAGWEVWLLSGSFFLSIAALGLSIWTARETSETARRQLRAYLIPEGGALGDGTRTNPPDPSKIGVPGAHLSIKNTGGTPAYNVISVAKIDVLPVVNESALVVPPIVGSGPFTLGSGLSFPKDVWFERTLTPYELADIETGVRAIYVHGRIEYDDVFRRRRFTDFRLRYVGKFPPFDGTGLMFCEQGNDAD